MAIRERKGITLNVEPEAHTAIKLAAAREHRTITGWILARLEPDLMRAQQALQQSPAQRPGEALQQ